MTNFFKYTLFSLGLLCQQTSTAQVQKAWILPKHQLQVQTGIVNNTDYVGFIDPIDNSYYGGVTYYYNFSPRWYASADYQHTEGTFKMGVRNYEFTGTEAIVTYDYPSAQNPWTMPIVRLNQDRSVKEQDIRASELVKVSSSNGQYSRTHYSLNGGYMRVSPRNILRIGVGISYFRRESRDILFTIVKDKIDNFGSSAANVQHLRVLDVSDMAFNARIAYDFFITQNLSIGLHLNAIMREKVFNSNARSVGITFGYALSRKNATPKA